MREHFITCSECDVDFLQDAAHDCSGCKQSTYSAFTYCGGCALEKDVCQVCGQPADCNLSDEARSQLTAARTTLDQAVAVARAATAEAIKPFAAAAAVFDQAMEAARTAYDANFEAVLQEYEKASLESRERVAAGADAQAEKDALAAIEKTNIEKRLAVGKELQTAQDQAFEALGKENLDVLRQARGDESSAIRRALAPFELIVNRIGGHLAVEKDYARELAALEEEED